MLTCVAAAHLAVYRRPHSTELEKFLSRKGASCHAFQKSVCVRSEHVLCLLLCGWVGEPPGSSLLQYIYILFFCFVEEIYHFSGFAKLKFLNSSRQISAGCKASSLIISA